MSDTIIDVVPRIHSDFVMPAIETVAANPVETPVVVESQRKKNNDGYWQFLYEI